MKWIRFFLVTVAASSLLLTACAKSQAPVTQNTEPPNNRRIIAGTVAAMQYANYLGIDLVGIVSTAKNVPERYKNTATIGLPMSPSAELVTALEPDLYIGEAMLKPVVEETLENSPHTEVVYLSGSSYNSIIQNIDTLCQTLHLPEKDTEVKALMEGYLAEAKAMANGKKSPTVAVLFGTPESFSLASSKSFVGDIIKLVGGTNISDIVKMESGYINFDREKLAEMNPDIILRLSHGSVEMMEENKKAFDKSYQEDYWQGLNAVKNKKVYDLDPNIFGVTVNMDSLQAPVEMAKLLYGED